MEKVTKVAPKPIIKKVAPKLAAKKATPKPIIKKVAPKLAAKKATPKPTVELVSYSIKMVIPTGAYANIQPEIIVKSKSLEDAHNYIASHMNKLWKEYFLINERRPEAPKAPVETTTASVVVPEPARASVEKIIEFFGGEEIGGTAPVNVPSNISGPDSSVALLKATQAIESCLSLEALELIESQVIKSVKLSHEDKEALMPLLSQKAIDLTFPEDEK
jgi:hypothetical protein